MNREIKFKFWSKLLHKFIIPNDDIFVGVLKDKNIIPCQFTGLKDKNGKEIYEGDIVIYLLNNDIFREVVFNKGCFVLKHTKDGSFSYIDLWDKSEFVKKIGNIYENPDLLK